MRVMSLRDLFIDELQDLFDAEQQIVQALPDLAAATRHDELKHALVEHLDQTKMQIERLRLICREFDVKPGGEPCTAMRGLLLETRTRLADTAPGEVRDAAIIGSAQRIEHYEIAAYGCARSYASQLGDWQAERLLQQTLDEESAADKRLTRIAERRVNVEAVREEDSTAVPGRAARLRYVPVDSLPSVNYAGFHAINRFDERLGDLKGFIVDGATGRPYYLVIDAGGLFKAHRYIVPVGRSRADLQARALRLDIDSSHSLEQYPEFDDAAFERMTDEDIDRYERQVLEAVAPREEGWAGPPNYDELPEYHADWIVLADWMTPDRDAQRPPRPVPQPAPPAAGERPHGSTAAPAPREFAVAREGEHTQEPDDHAVDHGIRVTERAGESDRAPARPQPPPTIDRSR